MWAAKSLSEISHVQPLWSCPSVELAISSHSGLVLPQPKPGSQVYLGLGLVQSGELKDVFFFFFFFFLQQQLVGFEPAIYLGCYLREQEHWA